ncbi:hypothetical protein HU200_067710 [Digitaria exilis]|uniref:Uncharacterized protein n=1 Tax=Digitaria exilis TaxID=1010633 RepID=A0A835A5I3_9POAL|nr:hypothetical protein HU200_067710 [Digitaria exilis]
MLCCPTSNSGDC